MDLQTPHFLIKAPLFDDDAQGRAQAIADACERDLLTLQDWFGCNFDDSRYGIVVYVVAGTHLGGASNRGYTTDQSSTITIYGTYDPPNGPPDSGLRDELARMVFVAELAEILMEFSGLFWSPKDSAGEALSILAAETLHPTGYYATGEGPRVRKWLNSNRPDYVSGNETTDDNSISYGCALLFLNYLRYQLSFSFKQIVAAAGWGYLIQVPELNTVTLADVFSTLTGRPAASAFKEFADLLQAHVPVGSDVTPLRDNLFPLRDAKGRSVSFSASEFELNAVRNAQTLLTKARAGPMCDSNIYSYHTLDVSSQLILTGRAYGFAQPAFVWSVNGVALDPGPGPQFITVPFSATDTVPGRGEPPAMSSLSLLCLVAAAGSVNRLFIFSKNFPGNGALTVSLGAREALRAGDPPSNYTDTPWIVTRRYEMAGAWYRDVEACNVKDLGLIHQSVKSLAALVVDDEDRPNVDPGVVRALAEATRRYVHALDEVTGGSRGLDRSVAGIFRQAQFAHAPLQPVSMRDPKGGLRMVHQPVETRSRHDTQDCHAHPGA